jgi:hypothetical protein
MSSMMMTWPKVVYTVPVSTTTSPVTHTADVEVNRAFKKLSWPGWWLQGSHNSTPPAKMTPAKPPIRRNWGDFRKGIIFFARDKRASLRENTLRMAVLNLHLAA